MGKHEEVWKYWVMIGKYWGGGGGGGGGGVYGSIGCKYRSG